MCQFLEWVVDDDVVFIFGDDVILVVVEVVDLLLEVEGGPEL